MKKLRKYIPVVIVICLICSVFSLNADRTNFTVELTEIPEASAPVAQEPVQPQQVQQSKDSTQTRYPVAKTLVEEYEDVNREYPIDLRSPENFQTDFKYDPKTNTYYITSKIGDVETTTPLSLTPEQYLEYSMQKSMQSYFRKKSQDEFLNQGEKKDDALSAFGMQFDLGPAEKIFGPGGVQLQMQGNAKIKMAINHNYIGNPTLPENQRNKLSFDFDEQIQASVNAKVGDKVDFGLNYNTEATFGFDTKKIKLAYQGKEDEIIKNLEAGNVSMTTSNSLIRGGAALFGIKTDLQFGKLRVGAIFSQQESQSTSAAAQNGVQMTPFEIKADAYEENKNFFLGHYFWDNYDKTMANFPYLNTSISITQIEVWVTNTRANYNEARNIVAFSDLGEHDSIYNKTYVQPLDTSSLTFNRTNNLYQKLLDLDGQGLRDKNEANTVLKAQGLVGGVDYEALQNARRLDASEYTFNTQLGYLSLKTALQADEVLAVAFSYKSGSEVYQVGEFSTDNPSKSTQNLYLKLLKGTTLSPRFPFWNLMMKNVYDLKVYSLQSEKFRMNILYQNDTTGTYLNFISEGNIANQMLLSVMNLDRLDSRQNARPDGFFDYVEGLTVNSTNGKIIFPVKEPFGSHLRTKIGIDSIADKYVFQELYDSTLTVARQIAEKNKFILQGEYKSASSSSITTGSYNLTPGSVRVTANGTLLRENTDYTVDYTSGEVTVINPTYENANIKVESENQSMYGMQRKTMMGLDLQYQFTPNFNLGATIMNLREMPITMKVNPGEESVNNTLYGFNTSYKSQSQWLTNMLDKLPFLELSAPSQISFNAEFAQLIPGHYKSEYGGDYSYIDDFEKAKQNLDMRSSYNWFLASTPSDRDTDGRTMLFPESQYVDSIPYGMNRSLLAWYQIDPLFTRKNNSLTPSYMKGNDYPELSNHYVREVYETELYPNKKLAYGEPTTITVLNLAYYPKERGPYNLDTDNVASDGSLLNPEKRWGGIMRKVDKGYTDFEEMNIEHIEFWILDPFIYAQEGSDVSGDLYFNLGEISEDVLKDEKKFFEDGLPTTPDPSALDTTVWGVVPKKQSLNSAFEVGAAAREAQDVGLNGLSIEQEKSFDTYVTYLDKLRGKLSPEVLAEMEDESNIFSPFNAPAGDLYHFYRGSDYDDERRSILYRYKRYNGTEGNSKASENSPESYNVASKITPDVEDINQDNTLNVNERYYQYKVHLENGKMEVGSNYITDVREAYVSLRNGSSETVKWYQFKIPVKEYQNKVGSIDDFKSIRFMRMFLTNFSDSIILRFGSLELVKGDWRNYTQALNRPEMPPSTTANVSLSTVNYEENSERVPVNYVLPPNVNRTLTAGQQSLQQENEQALSLKVTNLSAGDARAIYKNTSLDTRQYRRLQMFVHAEKLIDDITNLTDNEMSVFIRLGSDYKNNYYEYSIPLKLTPARESGNLYQNGNLSDREAVWPNDNMVDFPFEILTNLKLERNKRKRAADSNVTYQTLYSETDPNKPLNTISIIGNPSISDIKVIMIGIRNNTTNVKSTEIWVNELRLTEFNEDGGWAANGALNVTLSDLGTVNLSGNIETAGFGGLDQGIMERNLDDHYQYNVSTNLELGKFFPEKAKVSLPMYYSYSEQIVSSKYDPLNQDILLKDALDAVETKAEKDSIKSYAQDKITTKSISFNNVRVGVKSKNPMPYDPANFSLGYSFTENKKQDASTEYERTTDTRLNLSYGYSPFVKPIEPFKNIKSESKSAKFAKEFTINYLPNSITFTSDMSRNYYELQLRDLNNMGNIPVSFREDFYWNRGSGIQWSLTKNLNLMLQTGTQARIESPYEQVNKKLNPDAYERWKDTVIQSILDMGVPIAYAQSFSATYNIPINFIPGLDWITASAKYNASYNWDKGADISEDIELGNTIKNDRTYGFDNINLNMTSLYNKSKFLREVNQKFTFKRPPTRTNNQRRNPQRAAQEEKRKKEEEKAKKEKLEQQRKKRFEAEITLSEDSATIIKHNLDNKRVRLTARGMNGKLFEIKYKSIDDNTLRITTKDTTTLKLVVNQLPKMEETTWYKIAQVAARGMMMVRTVGASYTRTDGMMLPNFSPNVGDFFGQGSTSYGYAPGLDFAFGLAGESYIQKAQDRGWMINNENNVTPAMINKTETFNFRASLEPFVGCNISLTALRTSTNTDQIYFMQSGMPKEYSGMFNMTTVAIGSAFGGGSASNGYSSKAFDKFLKNREIIMNRLEEQFTGVPYPSGSYLPNGNYNPANGSYTLNSPDVLIPAFLAAYTGKDPNKVGLSAFPSLKSLLPNWKVTYDGLIQLEPLQKHFKTISLSHAYTCTYSVGNYTSYSTWIEADNGLGFIRGEEFNNPIPSSPYSISSVNITESFNPLFGVNATFQNNMTMKLELRKKRNLSLNVTAFQIVESANNDYVIGLGYKLTEFNKVLKMKSTGGNNFSNDLTVSADLSYQKIQTLIRKIEEAYTQATNGESQTVLKLSAQYNLSRMLTFEAFFDKQISKPLVSSTAYPFSKTSFGVSLNVNLTR